jgi:hypothetical protein
MFYRSGWLRCVGFIYWNQVYDLRIRSVSGWCGVRFWLFLLVFRIDIRYYKLYIILSSSSVLPLIPSSPYYSSLLFNILYFSSPLLPSNHTFILYVSVFTYTHLYSGGDSRYQTNWPRMFYRSGWLRCVGLKYVGTLLAVWVFGCFEIFLSNQSKSTRQSSSPYPPHLPNISF